MVCKDTSRNAGGLCGSFACQLRPLPDDSTCALCLQEAGPWNGTQKSRDTKTPQQSCWPRTAVSRQLPASPSSGLGAFKDDTSWCHLEMKRLNTKTYPTYNFFKKGNWEVCPRKCMEIVQDLPSNMEDLNLGEPGRWQIQTSFLPNTRAKAFASTKSSISLQWRNSSLLHFCHVRKWGLPCLQVALSSPILLPLLLQSNPDACWAFRREAGEGETGAAVFWNVLPVQTGPWKFASPSTRCKSPQVKNTQEAVSPTFTNLSLRGSKVVSRFVQNRW